MLSAVYDYAPSYAMREILQDYLPKRVLDDPIFEAFPINSKDVAQVAWEIRDNYTGLMAPRAPGGPYGQVLREGRSTYVMTPGHYGDQKVMNEQFLEGSREIGSPNEPIDITGEQGRDQEHLVNRAIDRVKQVLWTMVTTGTYTALDLNGNVVVQDSTPITPFTVGTAWSTFATATPLLDMRTAKLRQRGHSVSFGRDAKLMFQEKDIIALLSNSNNNDLGGRRAFMVGPGIKGQVPLSLKDVNAMMLDYDLPMIMGWDDGYYPDGGGSFTIFLPEGTGVMLGARTNGDPIGEFTMTRNPEIIANGGKRGKSVNGLDNLYYDFEFKHHPLRAISTLGLNGAPEVHYPSAIVPFNTLNVL